MRLIDIEDPALFDKVYIPSDNAGIEEYPRMIEWADLRAAPTVEAVVLPCKPGTTVYEIHNNTDACLDCPHHAVYFNDEDCTHPDYAVYYPTIQDSPVCEKHFWEVIDHTATELFLFNHRECFGKTIFLTREAAEEALAKIKGGAKDA